MNLATPDFQLRNFLILLNKTKRDKTKGKKSGKQKLFINRLPAVC